MRNLLIVICGFFGVSSMASANECVSLWIERNTIFDQAGYCFGSALGKGYFDNSDCTTKNPSLSRGQSSRISSIKARERQLGCEQQKKHWTVTTLRNNGAAAPALQQNARSCIRSAEIYFDVAGRWEIAKELSVSGPWYVSPYSTGQQSFLNANSGKCVGGKYSYRYVAEVDDLGDNPTYVYSGSFTISDFTKRCEVSITERSGSVQFFCE